MAAWKDPVTGKIGRDPDFFELLKAAINVGSLAKGSALTLSGVNPAPWTTPTTEWFQQQRTDDLTSIQILQIGANIIDQFDSDSYPTRIAFANDAADEVRGIEDLPYIYRLRDRPVQSTATNGEMLFLPELWNPHAQNGTVKTGPKQFRFRVEAADPNATFQLQVNWRKQKRTNAPYNNYNLDWSQSQPMVFNAGEANGYYGFREPTLLAEQNQPSGTNLNSNILGGHTTTEAAPAGQTPPPPRGKLAGIPAYLVSQVVSPSGTSGATNDPAFQAGTTFSWYAPASGTYTGGPTEGCDTIKLVFSSTSYVNCYLEYIDSQGQPEIYDQQRFLWHQTDNPNVKAAPVWDITNTANVGWAAATRTDPRTSRWGLIGSEYANDIQPTNPSVSAYIYPTYRSTAGSTSNAGVSYGEHIGGIGDLGFVDWYSTYSQSTVFGRDCLGFQSGYWTENSIRPCPGGTIPDAAHYNRDVDGVVRRVIGGYASDPNSGGASNQTPGNGLPMVTGNNASRPIILNRPFRSVAELGNVFRGTPWSNINMSFPESGDTALLDVFCVNEVQNTTGLVAGRVNVNTRQQPVLQALFAGTTTDDTSTTSLSSAQAAALATTLYTRTSSTPTANETGPLTNRGQLVGQWSGKQSGSTLANDADPDHYYSGFSYDIGAATGLKSLPVALIPRQREAAIRALADTTTARTWNLLIDLVAQTGRYPVNSTASTPLANFLVEGERRYWLHVAIDRYTGQVLDQQLETVSE